MTELYQGSIINKEPLGGLVMVRKIPVVLLGLIFFSCQIHQHQSILHQTPPLTPNIQLLQFPPPKQSFEKKPNFYRSKSNIKLQLIVNGWQFHSTGPPKYESEMRKRMQYLQKLYPYITFIMRPYFVRIYQITDGPVKAGHWALEKNGYSIWYSPPHGLEYRLKKEQPP